MENQDDTGVTDDNRHVGHGNLSKKPMLGMIFELEDQAYEFYNSYARSVGFSIRRHWTTKCKTDKKKILSRIFCCSNQGQREKHTSVGTPLRERPTTRCNCEAQIKIQLDKDGKYVLTDFVENHNHDLVLQREARYLRSHRKIRPAEASLITNVKSADLGPSQIYAVLGNQAGGSQYLNFTRSNCDHLIQKRRTHFLQIGDAPLLLDYLENKKKENKSFYYSIQVDEIGQIRNCFWSDAKSQLDYHTFGDVVCFDTTYQTNQCEMPFAPFVGVNHHRQCIIFGGAFLTDETTENFIWLFHTFLDAMGGKTMKIIFSDQAMAIGNAIKTVFPDAHHRLCIWHIQINALRHLSHVYAQFSSFSSDFNECIYNNEIEDEFVLMWQKLLIKYNLEEDEWLKGLFKSREKWAQVYGREHFCAGMASTQRSETMNKYFKKYFKRKTILREFIEQYDKALIQRREKEVNADFISRTTKPILITSWNVENRASEIYTRKMFNVFQKEVRKVYTLMPTLIHDDGVICTYEVSTLEGDGRSRTVTLVSSDNTIKCTCQSFEFTGLLCSHALTVLRERKVIELPSIYFIKRWSKDAISGAIVDPRGKEVQVDPNPTLCMRHSKLSIVSQAIIAEGCLSEDICVVAERELQRALDVVRSYSRSHQEPSSSNNDANKSGGVMGEKLVANQFGPNITILAPPSKKMKDQPSGRIQYLSDKVKKTATRKANQKKFPAGTTSKDDGNEETAIQEQHSYQRRRSNRSTTRSLLNDSVPLMNVENVNSSNFQHLLTSQRIELNSSQTSNENPSVVIQTSTQQADYIGKQFGSNTQQSQGFLGLLSQQSSQVQPIFDGPTSPASERDFSNPSMFKRT